MPVIILNRLHFIVQWLPHLCLYRNFYSDNKRHSQKVPVWGVKTSKKAHLLYTSNKRAVGLWEIKVAQMFVSTVNGKQKRRIYIISEANTRLRAILVIFFLDCGLASNKVKLVEWQFRKRTTVLYVNSTQSSLI